MFNRVLLIGTTCSGKSTLAREIAALVDAPLVELDHLFWKENWQESTDEELGAAIQKATAGSRWIVDGNYHRLLPVYWDRIEAVIFVNTPLPKVLWRVISRTFDRWWHKTPVCNGNFENPLKLLQPGSLLMWALKTNYRRFEDFPKRVQKAQHEGKRGYEVRTAADRERLLRDVAEWQQLQTRNQ